MDINTMQVAALILIAFAPVVGLLLVRKKLVVLNAAAWLVTWGAVVLSAEPMAQFVEGGHASFHFFITGAYPLVAGVLLVVVAWTILRKRNRTGWCAVLFTLLFGAAFELVARTTIFTHARSPQA